MRSSAEPRFKRRVPCRLTGNQSTTSGVVLDLSRRGLFVQTAASARPGDRVEIALRHGVEPDIVLHARVVWQRQVPFQLRSTLRSGIGVQIQYASESYYSLLAEAAAATGSAAT